jgi:hypothetical protein
MFSLLRAFDAIREGRQLHGTEASRELRYLPRLSMGFATLLAEFHE